MSNFKDILCLLVIFVAYGITGRMDYDDAVMLEDAQRAQQQSTQLGCPMAVTSVSTEHPIRALFSDSHQAPEPDAIEPCPVLIY